MVFATYEDATSWLFKQLPVFQNQGAVAFKPGLERIRALCDLLGQPQSKFPAIHVGGTNGKGSVSHMLAAVLQANGYKTGLYTSPHLADFRERIRINGEVISRNEVLHFLNGYERMAAIEPTFFELGVAMALDHFARHQVDVAVVEVGMGGRLDATSVVASMLTVVTNIGLDHTQYLGETRPLIAAEKAAIARKGVPMVLGEPDNDILPVFESICNHVGAPLFTAHQHTPKRSTDLGGSYQKKNLCTLEMALEHLPMAIDEEKTVTALNNVVNYTGLRGRWEKLQLSPLVIADTAHNAEGIRDVMQQLIALPAKNCRIVWGMVSDKPVETIAKLLPEDAIYYLCAPNVPRGRPVDELYAKWPHTEKQGYASVHQAYSQALADAHPDDVIYVGGSTFVVGEIIQHNT